MPEFEYAYKKELSAVLANMGIQNMFGSNANFSNMSMLQLFVDKVIHNAYIKVDRNGTKAAAATAAVVCLGALPPEDFKIVTLDSHSYMRLWILKTTFQCS